MEPAKVTEDYYAVLELTQTATREQVIRSYKQLALKLHPDRNPKHDATQAFQLLGRAYETLKDLDKRTSYDKRYHLIRQNHAAAAPKTPSTPHPSSKPSPKWEAPPSERAQIFELQKRRQSRRAHWYTETSGLCSSIFKLQESICLLEHDIVKLENIAAAEAAEEARKNSWTAWVLKPILRIEEDSEDEKERKDIKRQERRIEKDMKERRLNEEKAKLEKKQGDLTKVEADRDAEDLFDRNKIRVLEERIWAREAREREERERAEREAREKIRKQQEERSAQVMREAAEALRKRQMEEQATRDRQQAEEAKRWREFAEEMDSPPRVSPNSCTHEGWWPKVQGRMACPACRKVWTYLLKCPGCARMACPRCQHDIRPRRRHPVLPRERIPRPVYSQFDEWD